MHFPHSKKSVIGGAAGLWLLAGCAGAAGSRALITAQTSVQATAMSAIHHSVRRLGISPITHVVIVIQENRTVDNLFNALPGANTAQSGVDSEGKTVALAPEPLTAPYDLSHKHVAWMKEYDSGGMNGFNHEYSTCSKKCPPQDKRAYAFVPPSEVQPYYTMAETYTFGDEMFETNQGPSFPAHQYLISGTSTLRDGSDLRASENPVTSAGHSTGGCDSPANSTVKVIDSAGNENQTAYPCFTRNTLMQELDAAGLTWRYYQESTGPGLWHAPDAIQKLWNTHEYASNVVTPSEKFLQDIAGGTLANVTWITPSGASSDHPQLTDGSGPSWVASVVNAIGASQYWNSTAVIVVWDDWGGWYDHVHPSMYNSYELGFRVPLIVVSPYARPAYISHVPHEFGSILKFTEETFGLPSLGTTDLRADDLSDCFDFQQARSRFKAIASPLGSRYFLHRRPSNVPIDDDE